MLIRYQDLISLNMIAADGSRHSIEDVFVADADLSVAYVVVDTGGWFSGRKAMIGIARFGRPDVADAAWPAEIDEAALEAKPEPAALDPATGEPHELPAAMLGPVGGMVSPRLLYGDRARDDEPIPPIPDPRGERRKSHLRPVGETLVDTEVHAEDGLAGHLMGLIFDTDDWKARYLIVATGGNRLPENQRVVPIDLLGGIDWDGRVVRLACPVARVYDSPDLHEMDGLAGKWYNKVLAYYGLQS